MGIGGGGGIGGSAQPPTSRELETTAFTEVTRHVVLAMLPPDSLEVIPFTQREVDELYNYRATPERPLLHPMLFIRHGEAAPVGISENAWRPVYNSLIESLPPEIKEWLDSEMAKPFAERDPDAVALNELLLSTALTTAYMEASAGPEVNSIAIGENAVNAALPFVGLRTVLSEAGATFSAIRTELDRLGPNDPNYDTVTRLLREAGDCFDRLNALRKLVESGNSSPEVRQQFLELSNELAQLLKEFNTGGLGGNFQALGMSLSSMCVVAGAWSAEGSPSLAIGLSIVSTALSNTDSDTGVTGKSFDIASGGVTNGLLGVIPTGTKAGIADLNQLADSLDKLPTSADVTAGGGPISAVAPK